MKHYYRIVISLSKIGILFIYTVIMSIIGGAMLFLPDGDKKYFIIARRWAKTILWFCRIKVNIFGLENIKDPAGIIYLANHAGMFDTWPLQANLPGQIRFVIKKEIGRIPIFGWILKYSGNILIDRKSIKGAKRSLDDARESIKKGNSIILYPEGTRTPDGKLQEFKRGSFSLAVQSNATIVPITVNGARSIIKKGELIINPGTVDIYIHEPIPPQANNTSKSYEVELMKIVKEKIASKYIEQP